MGGAANIETKGLGSSERWSGVHWSVVLMGQGAVFAGRTSSPRSARRAAAIHIDHEAVVRPMGSAQAIHGGFDIPLCRGDHQARLIAEALNEVAFRPL